MGYFTNNRTVNFKELEESGIYLEDLLKQIKNGNYEFLNEALDETNRRDRDFMEPLLYAVKNEHGTYEIYKYYGDNLQENLDLAREIIIEEPELIKDSPVSSNKQFILQAAGINSKVVIFMSNSLKSDSEFAEQLCQLQDREVTMYTARECKLPDVIIESPSLAHNPIFMKEAIREDATLLAHVAVELKNNREFIQEACKENKEVINYIADNTEQFGKEGLNAAKEVLVDNTASKAIEEFKEELAKVQEEKDINKSRKIAIRERQLRNNMKFIEKIKNGEVKPERAIRLINSLGENLGEEYKQELIKYIKMDDAILAKQKEEKKEPKIEPRNIENISEGARISEINGQTQAIREEYIKQTEEKEVENVDRGTGKEKS